MKKYILNVQYLLIFVLVLPIIVLSCNKISAESEEATDYNAVTGMVKIWSGSSAPKGYLICDGREVSRNTYSDLFNIIGTTYGDGDGTTTFNLPNIKGKVIVGLNSDDTSFDTIGKTGGEQNVTLTTSTIPSHNHTFTGDSHNHTFTGNSVILASSGAHTHTLNNHTHTVPARSGYLSPNGTHSHYIYVSNNGVYSCGSEATGYKLTTSDGFANRVIVNNADTNYTANLQTGTQSANHTHTVSIAAFNTGSTSGTTGNISANHTHTVTIAGTNDSVTVGGTVGSNGSGDAHNNLQPYITSNYIIKY